MRRISFALNIFTRRAVTATAVVLAIVASRVDAQVVLGPGAIVSSVRDASGKPVAGALVVAEGPTTRQAVTSAAGIVTLLGLPLGKYVVSVSRSGYESTTASVVIRSRTDGIKLLKLSVLPATFADLATASLTGTAPRLDESAPYAAQALAAAVVPDIVPGQAHAAATCLAFMSFESIVPTT